MRVWVSVTRRRRAPLRAAAMAPAADAAGVVLDPDAYDDDATDGTRGEGSEDFDAQWRRATTEKRADVEAFEAMVRARLGDGLADARWERALMKMRRDARFRALKTHSERRAAFDALRRRAAEEKREGERRRRAARGEDEADADARRARALRAREAEASERRRRDEREARFRKERLLDDEAEAAFRALCAERVKTYARSYDEAFRRDLVGDPMGRDDVSRLRGGEARARTLYEAHRLAVEASLKAEFEKLARRIIDKLVVRELSDETAANEARARRRASALDVIFDGALAYARAAEDEFELVDDVLFAFVSDGDKKQIWTECAIDILSRHGVKIGDDRVEDGEDEDEDEDEDGAVSE